MKKKKQEQKQEKRRNGYRKHEINEQRAREADEELLEGRSAWMDLPERDHHLRTS